MYGKIFQSIFDSTLIEDRDATYAFMCMIVLADRDGQVDMTRSALSRRINMPLDELNEAIDKLQSEDGGSRHKDFGGARIVQLDPTRNWGWRLVNYEVYRSIASDDDRREQNRIAQQRFRDRSKQSSAEVSTDKHLSDQSAQGEGEGEVKVDTEGEGKTIHAPGLNLTAWKMWIEYRKEIGKKLKPASVKTAQKKLAAFGADQIQVVEQSIANGWTGLFAVKSPSKSGRKTFADYHKPQETQHGDASAVPDAERVD